MKLELRAILIPIFYLVLHQNLEQLEGEKTILIQSLLLLLWTQQPAKVPIKHTRSKSTADAGFSFLYIVEIYFIYATRILEEKQSVVYTSRGLKLHLFMRDFNRAYSFSFDFLMRRLLP